MAATRFAFEDVTSRLKPMLQELIERAGFRVTFEVQNTAGVFDREFENPDLVVAFTGPDADLLLENKAELLKAIEHVCLEGLRVSLDGRERILFDCQEYRMMRVDELQLAARAAAEKVRRTGASHKFSPMNSRERRVIHMALRGEPGVRTESEGMGQYRLVAIHSTHPSARPQGRAHRPSR